MTTHFPRTPSIPSCWTKRVQADRTTANSGMVNGGSITLSFPLTLCCQQTSDTLPVGEEVPLAQTILPELLVTVVLNASGAGTLRSRPRPTTSLPQFQMPIGTVFITLDELAELCSGSELPISMSLPSFGSEASTAHSVPLEP